MNTMIPMLLFVSAVAFAPQSEAQQARQLKEPIASARSGSRVPLDVSLQGLGDVSRIILGDACAAAIKDRAGAGCLRASSTPIAGMLFPYPGVNNTFGGLATIGGGRNNDARGYLATIGGGGSGFLVQPGYYYLGGNSASGYWSTIGGGAENDAGLCNECGEGIDESRPVTGAIANHNDPDCGHPVIAQGQAHTHKDGH